MIIVITGTPGTGKTTIAKLLEKLLNAKNINTTELALKENFIIAYDFVRKTNIIDENKLKEKLLEIISNTSTKYLIIDTSYPCIVPKRNLTVILKASLEELKKRLSNREWPDIKIQENMEAEILGEIEEEIKDCVLPDEKIVIIDTTKKTPEDIASSILSYI